ncbi:MAG: threonylcarbamoyl-AMP synthase [Erysipelotrichaceae bacterium]|nr:threonylcarbamoyl-AMP synthase [Erysipelotrichaceae bacterium]
MLILNKENTDLIVKALIKDKVIAYPTDTVYGLASRFDSIQAKQNLINKKNRPHEKSFPIMVSDIEMMKTIAIVTKEAEIIIKEFMPGPLTVILKKQSHIDDYVNDGKETLAIRLASDNYIKKIIEELGSPIFLTSANKSNLPVCTNEKEIEEYDLADLIVKGKPLNNIASTIVDLSDNNIKVLREGPISLEDINKVLIK